MSNIYKDNGFKLKANVNKSKTFVELVLSKRGYSYRHYISYEEFKSKNAKDLFEIVITKVLDRVIYLGDISIKQNNLPEHEEFLIKLGLKKII